VRSDVKQKFNILDVQHKFRSIQIPKSSKDTFQVKNLHRILNQGSALVFKDIIEQQFLHNENKKHFQSFEQLSRLERRLNGGKSNHSESSQEIGAHDIEQSLSDSEQEYSARLRQQKFKKLSSNSMVWFDDFFKIDKDMMQ
jgi:hypothetical protein